MYTHEQGQLISEILQSIKKYGDHALGHDSERESYMFFYQEIAFDAYKKMKALVDLAGSGQLGKCPVCETYFAVNVSTKKYCSETCRDKRRQRAYKLRKKSTETRLATLEELATLTAAPPALPYMLNREGLF